MTSLEQVHQEIQTLSPEALELLVEFVQLLKKTNSTPSLPKKTEAPADSAVSVYERFKASGLIGSLEAEENLSTTYKQVLAKEWCEKYDHR